MQAITDSYLRCGRPARKHQPAHVVGGHHVSRLKLFAKKDLLVTLNLLDHVACVDDDHVVQELRDCHFDKAKNHWTILVKWMGLGEMEATWEPVANLVKNVLDLVRNIVLDYKVNVLEMARQVFL